MAYPDEGVVQTWLDALREVGLTYLPGDLKRPSPADRVQEIPIPLDCCQCHWLPRAVQDTADRRKATR